MAGPTSLLERLGSSEQKSRGEIDVFLGGRPVSQSGYTEPALITLASPSRHFASRCCCADTSPAGALLLLVLLECVRRRLGWCAVRQGFDEVGEGRRW
jgi:hypothetical protein